MRDACHILAKCGLTPFHQGFDVFEFVDHGVDDMVFGVGVGVAAPVVEATLYVGSHQVGEHFGQMLGKAFLGTVGTEEAELLFLNSSRLFTTTLPKKVLPSSRVGS